jgi:hypothetical protein
MTDEIVKRLRSCKTMDDLASFIAEAADRIEDLERENKEQADRIERLVHLDNEQVRHIAEHAKARRAAEAERDKLRAALVEIGKEAAVDDFEWAAPWAEVASKRRARLHRIAILAQATQEASNATQEEKQNAK